MKEIKLIKSIFEELNGLDNNTLSNCIVLWYAHLRDIYLKEDTTYYVSVNQVIGTYANSIEVSKAIRDNLRKAMTWLIEKGYVKDTSETDTKREKSEWILDLSNLYFEKGYFIVFRSDVKAIMTLDERDTKKMSILRYYLTLMSTTYDKVGECSIEYLSQLSGLDNKTIMRYNEILERNKIIYIHRCGYIKDNAGKLKAINNHYGHYNDRDIIKSKANEHIVDVHRSKKANEKRSKKQKERHEEKIMKDGTEIAFEAEEKKEVKTETKKRNEAFKYISDIRNFQNKGMDIPEITELVNVLMLENFTDDDIKEVLCIA